MSETLNITSTSIPDVLILEPRVFADERGFFLESFNRKHFSEAIGRNAEFVQDNHSSSVRHVLRGLHVQVEQPQGKLVRVLAGEVFYVAVDVRRTSPSFRAWVGVTLSGENKRQVWIPEGFAHGFLVMSDTAEVVYKTTDYWAPQHERTIRWDDPEIGIAWPTRGSLRLSAKDREAPMLAQQDCFS